MKLLLLEFNEIDPGLLDQAMDRGELPAFARLRAQSACYETDACDSYLEPWVQWVTLHTGVPLAEHGAVQLTLGSDVPQPFVWETLAAAGRRVWVCGAMNARVTEALRDSVLPDYWTPAPTGSPFRAFSSLANAAVTRHIDRRHLFPWAEAATFVRFMIRHGARPATWIRALRHAATAVLRRTPWRLAFALEEFQLDLFLDQCRRRQPHFAVFFVNSVAHLQHNYWREMQPERFATPPPAERLRHAAAIPAGYRHLDRLLGYLLDSAGRETTILLCSALGQQPHRPGGHKGDTLYRADDLPRLVEKLKLPQPARILRTMADTFILEYADVEQARYAQARLAAVRVGAQSPFRPELRGSAVLVDGDLTHETEASAQVTIGGAACGLRLEDLMRVGHHVGGVHHRRGLLWVRGDFPAIEVEPDRSVPLTRIAPLIERHFEVREARRDDP